MSDIKYIGHTLQNDTSGIRHVEHTSQKDTPAIKLINTYTSTLTRTESHIEMQSVGHWACQNHLINVASVCLNSASQNYISTSLCSHFNIIQASDYTTHITTWNFSTESFNISWESLRFWNQPCWTHTMKGLLWRCICCSSLVKWNPGHHISHTAWSAQTCLHQVW